MQLQTNENLPAELSDSKEFEVLSWGMMDDELKAAWLLAFIVRQQYTLSGGRITFDGRAPVMDHNLIALCESQLDDTQTDQYLRNCLSEASAIAYKDMTPEQVSHPSTAMKFYSVVMMLPLESKSRSLYWAFKGEDV